MVESPWLATNAWSTLDLSRTEARELALALIERADIVVENFPARYFRALGLRPPPSLLERFPHTVWVRVSGYGQDGPYAERGGYATVAEGFSGLASISGYPDRGPIVSAYPLGDYVAGTFGAFGAMSAVFNRLQGGPGQIVDVSLFEPFFSHTRIHGASLRPAG